MDLITAQISEIKNLNLIQIYATDSIFNNNTNKYIGARVVFNNNNVLSLNYKDKHFQIFIKKILEKYKEEKDNRNIILLGELTKKLVADPDFQVLNRKEKVGVQDKGISALNIRSINIKFYEHFIKETIKLILMIYKKYESIDIKGMSGFNNKYIINYNINGINKQIPLIILQIDGNIIFKINKINDLNIPINGIIKSENGSLNISWQNRNEEIVGNILYDAENKIVERKVSFNGITIFHNEDKEEIEEKDLEIIKFYYDLCELEIPNNILKTSSKSFLMSSEEKTVYNEKDILYKNVSSQMSINVDEVHIKYRIKDSISKYDYQLNITLDEYTKEIILKKIANNILLMQVKLFINNESKYNYICFETENDIDLTKSFSPINIYPIEEEINTLDNVKKYINKKKRGMK